MPGQRHLCLVGAQPVVGGMLAVHDHTGCNTYAEREGLSVNQLIATALARKLAALGVRDYLQSRAQRASRAAFEQALAQVSDGLPTPASDLRQG